MKTINDLGIHPIFISTKLGDGYMLVHKEQLATSFAAVVADENGRMSYACNSFVAGYEPDLIKHLENAVVDTKSHVSWAFHMAGVDGSFDELMDILHIPYVNREASEAALKKNTDEAAKSLSIDQEALKAMAKSATKNVSALEFYTGDSDRAVIRRQAAESYPLLAEVISTNLMAKMAVDRKKPIADALVNVLTNHSGAGVSRPVMRKIAVADALPQDANLKSVVRLMCHIPPDWIPTSGDDWHSFCTLATSLYDTMGCKDEQVALLVKASQGRWAEYLTRLNKRAGNNDPDRNAGFKNVMQNASEMVHDFMNIIVLPIAAHSGNTDTVMVTPEMGLAAQSSALELLSNGRTLADMADLQRRFHLGRAGLLEGTAAIEVENRQKLKGEILEGDWPKLTEIVQAPNGLFLVPISNSNELSKEGNTLNHCVGSYTNVARRCESFIVSVREELADGTTRSLSTIEYEQLNPDNDGLKQKQHKGPSNSTPLGQSLDAAMWYVNAIKAGKVKLNRKLIEVYLDNEPIPEDGVERLCGYDWRDRNILNTAVMPWGPFVAKQYHLSLDDLMDSTIITTISEKISPDLMMNQFR